MYNIPYHGEKDLSSCSFLVTGGAGFIGSNLVAYLLKFGAGKVRVLDNFSTGSVNNLENFSFYPSFEIIDGDVLNLNDWKEAVAGIDVVFHQADISASTDPLSVSDFNIRRLNMLIAANVAGVKRIVDGACTFLKVPDVQNDNIPPDPVTRYVSAFYKDILGGMYGTACIGLQYATVFGPHCARSKDIVSALISGLIARKSISVSGDAAVREFTYIENAVQANIVAALCDHSLSANTVYGIDPRDENSLNDVVAALRDILALIDPEIAGIELAPRNKKFNKTRDIAGGISRAETLPSYHPYFELKDGLVETVKFYLEEERSSSLFY